MCIWNKYVLCIIITQNYWKLSAMYTYVYVYVFERALLSFRVTTDSFIDAAWEIFVESRWDVKNWRGLKFIRRKNLHKNSPFKRLYEWFDITARFGKNQAYKTFDKSWKLRCTLPNPLYTVGGWAGVWVCV